MTCYIMSSNENYSVWNSGSFNGKEPFMLGFGSVRFGSSFLQNSVSQHGDLVLYVLRYPQPMICKYKKNIGFSSVPFRFSYSLF